MDNIIRIYGETDLSSLTNNITNDIWAGPNQAVPYIALGHAYLNRFENGGTIDDYNKALSYFEFVSSPVVYNNWGLKWASAPTAAFLLCGIQRLKASQRIDVRVDYLVDRGEAIAEAEADMRLTDDFPYKPYISGTPQDGDTKAEENAWESSILAWASQMYPAHPRASMWERKGRQLAQFSIVRESDKLYFNGNQIITVEEDFTLTNHWVRGNPYYTGGVIVILRIAALAYYMTGQDVPSEYEHNLIELYNNYKSKCTWNEHNRLVWTQQADPEGDPTIFPLSFDKVFENQIAGQKARENYLWVRTDPKKVLTLDDFIRYTNTKQ